MTYLLRDNWAVWVTIFCTRQSFGRRLIKDSSTNTAPICHPLHYTEASQEKLCSARTLITSYSAWNTYLHELYNMVTTNGLQRLALSVCRTFLQIFVFLNTAAVTGTCHMGSLYLPGICGVHFILHFSLPCLIERLLMCRPPASVQFLKTFPDTWQNPCLE